MKNTEETIRAYSMANYPAEGDRIMLTVRIATPPFKPKDQGPGFAWKEGKDLILLSPTGTSTIACTPVIPGFKLCTKGNR